MLLLVALCVDCVKVCRTGGIEMAALLKGAADKADKGVQPPEGLSAPAATSSGGSGGIKA
jgi:hypothetical protein